MHLRRGYYADSGYTGITVALSVPIVIFISFSIVIFFAYRNYKKNKKKTLRRVENADYELSVYNQASGNRDHAERRQERPENNGLSNEFCDPLPLYTPPENPLQTKIPQHLEDRRVNSPPYSVSQ